MKYKKLLFTILVVVMVMFTLMLATSYAWYSFNTGATTFDAVTSNKDVDVHFIKGEFINDTVAVPIESRDVDQYSDKHQFIVRTKNNRDNNEVLLNVSLVDIAIDDSLKVSDFKVELYYQGSLVSLVTGEQLASDGDDTKLLKTVTLNKDIDNNFEVRVYILDNGKDQSNLMNLNFSAKIQAEAVSRLKLNNKVSDYSDADIQISSIVIDGEESKSIPSDGYYTMRSSCIKGSQLSWDGYHKTITYEKGSKVGDSCRLVFTSSTSDRLLNTVEVGSYVKYKGNNGCSGKSCEGQNANYVSDDDMGYCSNKTQGFVANGWRVAYIKDGSVYLTSAGSPECMCTNSNGISSSSCGASDENVDISKHINNLNQLSLKYCNSAYAYNNICNSSSSWNMSDVDFQYITGNNLDIASFKNSGFYDKYLLINNGGFYWFSSSLSRAYFWNSSRRTVNYDLLENSYGIRPILRLRSSVVIAEGAGTYEDPYIIK